MLKARSKLGKYRIERRFASGGYADVYKAFDTIEGVHVALKVPHSKSVDPEIIEGFRKEVRLTAPLEHPNILPVKNADYINDRFVIVTPLGKETLADRLSRRISTKTALAFSAQLLSALATAHAAKIIHCDVKPENIILFGADRIRLADFGIARVALRNMAGSGTGTIGYMAPEQAMGKPSFRSDVFSAGLVIYRLLSGRLPEWPYEWPPVGFERLKGKVSQPFIEVLRKSLEVDMKKRYKDAEQMLRAFQRVKPRAIRISPRKKSKGKSNRYPEIGGWKTVRLKEFLKEFRSALDARHECNKCGAPVSEAMQFCPWCRSKRSKHKGETKFPATCPRCERGVKLDWKYCAWCHGPSIGPLEDRVYSDARYTKRCTNSKCHRKDLMPFMRYCPWCKTRVKKSSRIEGSRETCKSCGNGTLSEFWDICPWCGVGKPNK